MLASSSTCIVSRALGIRLRRLTCVGLQYIIGDHLSDEIVTIAPDGTCTCTCGLESRFLHCPHKPLALKQEYAYQQEAEYRWRFSSLFCLDEVA